MPVNRRALKRDFFPAYNLPEWLCSTCKIGELKLQKKTLHYLKTSQTLMNEQQEDWDVEDELYRFSAMFKCANGGCGESFSALGTATYTPMLSEDAREFKLSFRPLYFNPSPLVINLPSECPQDVREELHKAFVLSWGDYYSAANRVRASVERLLDYLKQKKTTINKKHKRVSICLHDRIMNLPKKYSTVKDSLLAIKWLGNAGSHTEDIKRDDIYDAFDIIESVLEKIFVNHGEKLNKLVKVINKAKGPRKTRKNSLI